MVRPKSRVLLKCPSPGHAALCRALLPGAPKPKRSFIPPAPGTCRRCLPSHTASLRVPLPLHLHQQDCRTLPTGGSAHRAPRGRPACQGFPPQVLKAPSSGWQHQRATVQTAQWQAPALLSAGSPGLPPQGLAGLAWLLLLVPASYPSCPATPADAGEGLRAL